MFVFVGTDLHITLYKKEAGLWGTLEVDLNKNELKILKNEAVLQQEELEKKLNENRYEKVSRAVPITYHDHLHAHCTLFSLRN